MKDNSSVLFSSKNIYFASKECIKVKIFGTFKFQNSSNSPCQFLNDKSIALQSSLLIVMAHNNSSINFKLIHFLLWTKESHQSPNFDTLKCSGENLPYYSCHFPNHKSVFLQILHHSSVS